MSDFEVTSVKMEPGWEQEVQRQLLPFWHQTGEAAERQARSMAPRQTGEFASSIVAVISEEGVVLTSDAPHAHFIEYGTATMGAQPTIRPALLGAIQR